MKRHARDARRKQREQKRSGAAATQTLEGALATYRRSAPTPQSVHRLLDTACSEINALNASQQHDEVRKASVAVLAVLEDPRVRDISDVPPLSDVPRLRVSFINNIGAADYASLRTYSDDPNFSMDVFTARASAVVDRYSEALALYREMGDRRGAAIQLHRLGDACLIGRDLRHRAGPYLNEAKASLTTLLKETPEDAAIKKELKGVGMALAVLERERQHGPQSGTWFSMGSGKRGPQTGPGKAINIDQRDFENIIEDLGPGALLEEYEFGGLVALGSSYPSAEGGFEPNLDFAASRGFSAAFMRRCRRLSLSKLRIEKATDIDEIGSRLGAVPTDGRPRDPSWILRIQVEPPFRVASARAGDDAACVVGLFRKKGAAAANWRLLTDRGNRIPLTELAGAPPRQFVKSTTSTDHGNVIFGVDTVRPCVEADFTNMMSDAPMDPRLFDRGLEKLSIEFNEHVVNTSLEVPGSAGDTAIDAFSRLADRGQTISELCATNWTPAVCGSCGVSSRTVSLKTCARCGKVSYCGRACQVNHWSAHKPVCKAASTASTAGDATAASTAGDETAGDATAASPAGEGLEAGVGRLDISDAPDADVDVDAMSIKELKAFVTASGLSLVGCFDKDDLRAKAREGLAERRRRREAARLRREAAAREDEEIASMTDDEVRRRILHWLSTRDRSRPI